MDAVSVGEVKKVVIHKDKGNKWLLDKVVLKAGEFAPKEMEFRYEG